MQHLHERAQRQQGHSSALPASARFVLCLIGRLSMQQHWAAAVSETAGCVRVQGASWCAPCLRV